MDKELHVDNLILIPTWKIYVFWYSGHTDGQTDGQTDIYILFLHGLPLHSTQESYPVVYVERIHLLRVGWKNWESICC